MKIYRYPISATLLFLIIPFMLGCKEDNSERINDKRFYNIDKKRWVQAGNDSIYLHRYEFYDIVTLTGVNKNIEFQVVDSEENLSFSASDIIRNENGKRLVLKLKKTAYNNGVEWLYREIKKDKIYQIRYTYLPDLMSQRREKRTALVSTSGHYEIVDIVELDEFFFVMWPHQVQKLSSESNTPEDFSSESDTLGMQMQ